MYKKSVVIAEIGCNHMGDINIAKQMIEIASNFCNADIIKFQKRTPSEILTKEEYNAPHPVPTNSFGETYGQHREFLEFNVEQHKELMDECKKYGKVYSCSVWDLTSAKEICSISPKVIKIPSACSNYFKLLDYIFNNFNGEIHLSLGMTTTKEREEIVNYFQKKGRNKDLVLYHCISGYPISFEDICLLEIKKLNKEYKNIVKDIGFSGHHLGIAKEKRKISSRVSNVKVLDVNLYKNNNDLLIFDCATLFHVLEHINNPISFLKAIKKHLSSDGKLIIEVPNAEDMLLDECYEY